MQKRTHFNVDEIVETANAHVTGSIHRSTIPISRHSLMMIIGVIEIVASVVVAIKPRIGAYVVMVWLWGIIINLLFLSGYYDVALRNFGLSLVALASGRLSMDFDR